MVELRELMSTDIHTLSPSATLREAADLLTAEHITGVPVVEGGTVVGVISATDVLRLVVSMPGAPTHRDDRTEWGTFGDPDPLAVEGEDQASSVYFTDMWEDAGADVLARFQETDRPEWDVLEEHTVSEAMSRGLYALSPDASTEECARYMLEHEIHRVLVLEDDVLVGVVTTTDLVRAVAEHGLGV